MPRITKMLRVRGRVQGVFYRASMREEARKLGLTGWVRNRTDGTVEALVQGDAAQIDALVAWARMGPPAAAVERVDAENVEIAEEFRDFSQRPTA